MRQITLLVLLCCLSACAYHLRSSTALPDKLHNLQFSSNRPRSAFSKMLRRKLQTAHIQLNPAPDIAAYNLHILNESISENISGVSGNTQLRQYVITYTVDFELLDHDGHKIIMPTPLISRRQITMNSNQLLGSIHERHTLEHDMRDEITGKILTKLATIQLS